jgi:hypothetical protein
MQNLWQYIKFMHACLIIEEKCPNYSCALIPTIHSLKACGFSLPQICTLCQFTLSNVKGGFIQKHYTAQAEMMIFDRVQHVCCNMEMSSEFRYCTTLTIEQL